MWLTQSLKTLWISAYEDVSDFIENTKAAVTFCARILQSKTASEAQSRVKYGWYSAHVKRAMTELEKLEKKACAEAGIYFNKYDNYPMSDSVRQAKVEYWERIISKESQRIIETRRSAFFNTVLPSAPPRSENEVAWLRAKVAMTARRYTAHPLVWVIAWVSVKTNPLRYFRLSYLQSDPKPIFKPDRVSYSFKPITSK